MNSANNSRFTEFSQPKVVVTIPTTKSFTVTKFNVPLISPAIPFTAPYPSIILDKPNPLRCELEFINTSINIGGIEVKIGTSNDGVVYP
jgi:hypothetical protein